MVQVAYHANYEVFGRGGWVISKGLLEVLHLMSLLRRSIGADQYEFLIRSLYLTAATQLDKVELDDMDVVGSLLFT